MWGGGTECAPLRDAFSVRVRTPAAFCHEWPGQQDVRLLTWLALPVP